VAPPEINDLLHVLFMVFRIPAFQVSCGRSLDTPATFSVPLTQFVVWYRWTCHRAVRGKPGMNVFPSLPTMDGTIVTSLKAQPYAPAMTIEHRDLQKALDAVGAFDNHGFTVFHR
jgi:hypothetical protein